MSAEAIHFLTSTGLFIGGQSPKPIWIHMKNDSDSSGIKKIIRKSKAGALIPNCLVEYQVILELIFEFGGYSLVGEIREYLTNKVNEVTKIKFPSKEEVEMQKAGDNVISLTKARAAKEGATG